MKKLRSILYRLRGEVIKTSPCYDETYTLRNKNFSAKQKQQMINEMNDNSVGFVE